MLTITPSSTVYMDGTAVYDVRRSGRPGILARLRLTLEEATALSGAFDAAAEDVADALYRLEGLDK